MSLFGLFGNKAQQATITETTTDHNSHFVTELLSAGVASCDTRAQFIAMADVYETFMAEPRLDARGNDVRDAAKRAAQSGCKNHGISWTMWS